MSNRIKNNLKNLVGQTLNQYYSKVKPTISDLRYKQEYQNRIIECMVGGVDDNYITTPETDNPIVKLEHSKEGLVKVPSIKGKTILVDAEGNETDTPGEGCRLVSVGEDEDNKMIILSKNKNLFEVNSYKFEPQIQSYYKQYVKLESGKKYILTYNDPQVNIRTYIRNSKNESVSNALYNNSTFVAPYTDTFEFKTDRSSSNYGTNGVVTNIQLEEGIKPTSYVESKQHKTEILLDEPLRKLPNGVCDEIVGNQLIRRIGSVTLDGDKVTSIGIVEDNVVDVLYFDKTVTNKKFINYGIEGQQLIKSNIYRTGIDANGWNSIINEHTLVNTNSNGFWIFLPKFTVFNINDARNYMNNKPTEVLYELAEPIIEELPNGITLQGFDNTTMYIENSITPIVQYGYNALIPYKEELSNQKEEVETNTLDIEQNIIPYLMDMEFNLMLMEDN